MAGADALQTDQPGKNRKSVVEHFERAWSQALLVVSTAEDEASNALGKVAELAGWGQEELRRHAREFADRLSVQRRDLERNMEETAKRTLSMLKVPRREQLSELQARLDRIEARLDLFGKSP